MSARGSSYAKVLNLFAEFLLSLYQILIYGTLIIFTIWNLSRLSWLSQLYGTGGRFCYVRFVYLPLCKKYVSSLLHETLIAATLRETYVSATSLLRNSLLQVNLGDAELGQHNHSEIENSSLRYGKFWSPLLWKPWLPSLLHGTLVKSAISISTILFPDMSSFRAHTYSDSHVAMIYHRLTCLIRCQI